MGRYVVREVIGTGGFATVYRATDDRLDADVAVKVLAENHSLAPEVRGRFIAEGRRLRQLRHPHLIAVHELGETDRAQPYLVLDWADRGDLARRVAAERAAGRPPTPADALAVGRSVVEALAVLHDRQVVHRDLAPGNLLLISGGADPGPAAGPGLVRADERLVLADLGLSKDLAAASGLTVAAGTTGFAPPEQRRAGSPVDPRADVWAAAALLVWLATGEPPPDDGAWTGAYTASGWPAALAPVLSRALAERPDDRPPTVRAWWAEVEAAVNPGGSAVAPRSATPSRIRRRRAVALAAAVALLAAAGGAGAAIAGRDGGPSPTTVTLDDGRARTVVEDHGITVTLTGPTELTVGEGATMTVAVEGTDSWVWVAPGPSAYAGGDTLELTPRSAGRSTVRVLAFGDGGRTVEVQRRLDVRSEGAAGED